MLRVRGPRFPGRESKKLCVEVTRFIEGRCGFDVIRIVQVSRRHAGFEDFVIRKARNRFNASGEVAPELLKASCARKPPGHPYDGDVELVTHLTVAQSLQGGSQRSFTRYGVNSR